MKHNLLSTANGLCTPPCGSSHRKSLSFQFRNSLLLLFLLMVGTNAVWASTNYFTPGKTLYFHVDGDCKNWGGNQFAALFYYQNNENKAYGYENENYSARQFVGNNSIGSSNRIKCTKINDYYYSVVIPSNGTANIGYVRLIHLNTDDGWCHQAQKKVSADSFTSTNNCLAYSAWDDGDPSGFEAYNSGECVTNACGGGGAPEPEPLSGDYYVYGAGGTNWVSGWSKPVEDYKMTISDGVASKTFYNVKGNGLNFKVWNKTTSSDIDWSKYSSSKSENITCSNCSSNNICFNLGSNVYDITVYTNGTEVWVKAKQHQIPGSAWRVTGTFNGWSQYNEQMSNDATNGCKTVTISNINKAYDKNGHGWIKFKLFEGTAWGTNVNADNSTVIGLDGTVIGTVADDNENADGRIIVQVDETSDITFSYYQYTDGANIVTVKRTTATPAATYTVTLHPNNGGSEIVRTNVPEGSNSSAAELNLSAVTYGLGTATWYTNEACTEPFTSVTSDMHLYAKWGVSGNYYFVSCLQTANDNGGASGNWSKDYGQKLAHTFIAPSGHMPFEVIKDKDWSKKINGGNYDNMFDNSNSDVTISAAHGHMDFTLDAPKKVSVSYNGKVTVKVQNYAFDNSKTWRIKTSWGNGGAAGNYNTLMTNNGSTNATAILYNVPAGQNSFVVTTKDNDNDAMATVGTETFNALYVDTSNPSSGLTWNTTSARRDGSDNFNSTTPQTDNRWRYCSFTLAAVSDIRISFDGGKIRCDIVAPNTVTFNSNGGSAVASQEVSNGQTATEPADPTKAGYIFSKWQLNGSDYNFSNPVTKDITLDAVWAYKPIESVSLNESTHMTWVDNSDFELTPTLAPSDLIAKSVAWSSDNSSIATVSDGTVHAVGEGTATITCTVTDKSGTQKTATCEVTVAACQMIVNNLYSMTVTGYDSKTGDKADLSGLWNESSDNDGPASMTRCNIRVGNNNGSGEWYAYDNNGQVFADNDATHYWYLYASNSTVGSNPVYYVQDVSTGKYMYMTTTFPAGQSTTSNPDWVTYPIMTGDKVNNNDNYLWYAGTGSGSKGVIVCYNGSKKANVSAETDGQNSCIISRHHWSNTWMWTNAPTHAVGASHGAHQGGGGYTAMQSAFVNVENIPNPAYIHSQMNTSYYRMNTDATVRANLNAALVKGAVITVRLYADAATTVKLQKTDGTEIETINLSADAEREYTYTVASNSALLDENAFVIKAKDNHAGIASIVVTRTYAAHPASPELTWDVDTDVTQSALEPAFQHIASSHLSSGAITYTSSNPTVATVAADGTVTPLNAGNTTITATIEEKGCYGEASITYNVTLNEPSLQEAINATTVSGTLTLTHDYNDNAVINKAITIDGNNHTIGDLTVELSGDLTLNSELKVRDFTICAKAGNTDNHAASGQVRNADKLNVSRNAYFLYTIEPGEHIQYGWYDFTVPFPVNVMTGIKGFQEGVLKENFAYGTDYAILEHLGDKQAAGEYAYKKFQGVMDPCRLYSITLDDDYNYKTLRFQKTNNGALVAADAVTLNAYDGGDARKANWNGVGNGTLHHANIGVNTVVIQVYQSGDNFFKAVPANSTSLAIGTAFMVQEAGTMTLSQASHALLAPKREASVQPTAIQIASEGKPFSDQLFISADETAGQGYNQGVDVAKAGNIGNVNVPQIWTNAYNTKLCAHEAQLINGEASYTLSLYAPADGTYTLTGLNIPENYTLYLTYNGRAIWNLSISETYALDLNKGITTEYGLLLVETYKTPTGMEEISSQPSVFRKILRNGILYILHNGKIYNAQGARVE